MDDVLIEILPLVQPAAAACLLGIGQMIFGLNYQEIISYLLSEIKELAQLKFSLKSLNAVLFLVIVGIIVWMEMDREPIAGLEPLHQGLIAALYTVIELTTILVVSVVSLKVCKANPDN